MQRAIELLAIKVPRTFSGGTYISDFEAPSEVEPPLSFEDAPLPEKRLYANKRGRKAAQRDELDLILAYQEGQLMEQLHAHNLLEGWPC